ncbi:histidine kinase [Methylobacterium sp. J-092]|uniref:phosphorylase family protein n=1 Tax=Methylobacterium sp. J-092 TaxID=2836667 RepID=UPI001FBACCD2|nr:histidine kinase [Methylobacterium sp. J-092]MCJ2007966.1 histidine kinase [Methylobacterium sp. J-092]
MLKVLVVEDDTQKYGRIHVALEKYGVEAVNITHVLVAFQAIENLSLNHYDLMLLDVNLPRRFGETERRGGGLEILHELNRNEDLIRPTYIVGITAYEDVIEEFGPVFAEQLWSIVHYRDTSDLWISQLGAKINYITAFKNSEGFRDGKTYGTDLVIICALDKVEYDAVKRLCDWEPLRLAHDDTRYLSGTITGERGTFSVVAAAAPRMGMPASAVLATKVIHQFRPRFIAMVGICAGRFEKVQIGDIIVADPTWDWGSGKIISEDKQPKFLPQPHQLDLDEDVIPDLKDLAEDASAMAKIKLKFAGSKPRSDLGVHFGPLVSGAAVVAHKPTFDSLLNQHRGILGIDMEAYSVAAAARGGGKPRPVAIIVKAVCDYADEQKDDDYQGYAAHVSAEFIWSAAKRFL